MENDHECFAEGKGTDHAEENEAHDGHGHGQIQTAMRQMGGFWPTNYASANLKVIMKIAREKADLNLQQVVTSNALVVHFMISVIGIAPIFVLNKGETNLPVSNKKTMLVAVRAHTGDSRLNEEQVCRSVLGAHNYTRAQLANVI